MEIEGKQNVQIIENSSQVLIKIIVDKIIIQSIEMFFEVICFL